VSRDRRHVSSSPADQASLPRIWSGLFDADHGLFDMHGRGARDAGDALLSVDGPYLTGGDEPPTVAYGAARLLVRVHGEPIGFVLVPLDGGRLDQRVVWDRIERELGAAVAPTLRRYEAGEEPDENVDAEVCDEGAPALPAWVAAGRAVPLSVVVCTRDRPVQLARCLAALARVEHDALEVVVVDNAPASDATARLVTLAAEGDPRIRYLREDRPGLSRARNRGLAEAQAAIVAFTDDDVRVDPLWPTALVRGFARDRAVTCVTGMVAGASLDLPAEQYFDERVSWSSNCERRTFEAAPGPGDSRLHPFAAGAFGTGANMAFRAAELRVIGGFDECLGAGSPAGGGEDLDAFLRVLLERGRIGYEPAALVWHEHRAAPGELDRQMYNYGKGLTAYLCKHALSRRSAGPMAGRVVPGLARLAGLSQRSRRAAQGTTAARRAPLWEVAGSLAGPWAYLRGRQGAAHPTRMS